ncbi:GLPGLI family protein [Natronoflexus pectinivorans]|uniref:GLPGLI family protein n=2 Tax=Natronoflexus pectinivorans TaxID=682526 RepID=A0A4R2GFW2_9BACT|nr:GLPGLI family protein [Natronoflexus pectinivorans]
MNGNTHMTLKNHIKLLSFVLIITVLSGCKFDRRPAAEKGITEGTIIYNITYPEQVSNALSFLFPNQMSLHFSNGNQRIMFKGNMNLYALDFIHNQESDSFYTLLKILERRIYVPSSKSDNMFIFDDDHSRKVEYIKNMEKEIAGFTCHLAQIPSDKAGSPEISIWYSNEIGMDNPNRNTPFDMIPGLIMEFQLTYENVIFHLEAQRVVEESHPDYFFMVPANYEQSSLEEVEELIKTVFN